MISNLDSARSLVKADLEHARGVLDLWTRQVSELEKTLEQIEAVGQSRVALREQHTGVKALGASAPSAATPATKGAKRGRKPKLAASDKSTASVLSKKERTPKKAATAAAEKPARANGSKGVSGRKAKKPGSARKGAAPAQPKFKDPGSDKTWAGHGRRPLWMTGDPQQYAIQPDSGEAAAGQANEAS